MTTIGVLAVCATFLAGLLVWQGSQKDDPTAFFTLAGGVLIVLLISLLATLARGQDQPIQALYFAAIGTLIGAILGIAGGAVVGNQAGQSAAETVNQQTSQSTGGATPSGQPRPPGR